MVYAPTAIDLSHLVAPKAIESLDFETLYSGFKDRFLVYWNDLREQDPSLPEYSTTSLESEAAGVVGEAWNYLRLLDRQRVNDAFMALLAPFATGTDLDALVSGRNIVRLVVIPATPTTAAVMEGDASLLRRYLESFDKPAAGSVRAGTSCAGLSLLAFRTNAISIRRSRLKLPPASMETVPSSGRSRRLLSSMIRKTWLTCISTAHGIGLADTLLATQ